MMKYLERDKFSLVFHKFCKNPSSSFCQQNYLSAEFSAKNDNGEKFCIQIMHEIVCRLAVDRQGLSNSYAVSSRKFYGICFWEG